MVYQYLGWRLPLHLLLVLAVDRLLLQLGVQAPHLLRGGGGSRLLHRYQYIEQLFAIRVLEILAAQDPPSKKRKLNVGNFALKF